MGIKGFSTFMSNESDIFKPYKLSDSILLVDGNCVVYQMYRAMAINDSVFGGDYDEIYKLTYDLFSMFLKCNIECFVLLDGGHDLSKMPKSLERVKTDLFILRNFNGKYSTSKFLPLFTLSAFTDALTDLKVSFIRCEFEADYEIATIARILKCPVLSFDSDFFIYDVLYIPFSSIQPRAVKYEDSNKYYVTCLLYSGQNLFNHFPGLDASKLPILATILGNDYVDNAIFNKFFNHLSIRSSKKSYTQRRIQAVLHWLQNENVESAISSIMNHAGVKNRQKIVKSIASNTSVYTNTTMSAWVADELSKKQKNLEVKKKKVTYSLPSEILKSFSEAKINNIIMDIINLGIYKTSLQVENVLGESSHFAALEIIRDIYTLLIPYVVSPKAKKSIQLYLVYKNKFSPYAVKPNADSFLAHILLSDLLKESKEERSKWLFSIINLDDDIVNIVSNNNWSLFLVSLVYWIKKVEQNITHAHVHALLLMAIANEVIQKEVGYFRQYCKKKSNPKKASIPDDVVELKKAGNFVEMLENVTKKEKLLVQDILIPYRQTTSAACKEGYSISTLHLFACFQSILFHIEMLNSLLNFPLPHLKPGDFYSGTLLFNFYLKIKNKHPVESFGLELFKNAPNLIEIYKYLCENSRQFTGRLKQSEERGKRKNIRKNKIYLVENTDKFVLFGV